MHQYNFYIWTRLNQIWTYDLMEQIRIIHGCITPLQYKVRQFTLNIWAWDHQKKKSLHFAKSTSPVCLDHLVKSPSPHCWTQANCISPMLHCLQLTSHQVHFLFLIAKILFKQPEAEYFSNCSMGEMYSLAATNFCPKKQKTTQFSKAF